MTLIFLAAGVGIAAEKGADEAREQGTAKSPREQSPPRVVSSVSTDRASTIGWKVSHSVQALSAKQGLYTCLVTVRDADGKPVEDADVVVWLPVTSREVRAHRVKPGWFQARLALRLGADLPEHLKVRVTSRGR